jgi:hypothetical protein
MMLACPPPPPSGAAAAHNTPTPTPASRKRGRESSPLSLLLQQLKRLRLPCVDAADATKFLAAFIR